MGYAFVLLPILIHTVFCYHFYNPRTNELLQRPTLDNIPKGYKLIPPPRSNTRRFARIRDGIKGYCGDGGFTCRAPYDKSQTFQFECSSDYNCPSNYKCCPQKCFLHKVCIKAIASSDPSKIIDGNKKNCNYEHQGQCDKWPYNCRTPYHASTTYSFKCDRDSQCPRNFKCCKHSCFVHKICSRTVEKIVPANETVTQQTITVTKDDYGVDIIPLRHEPPTTPEEEDTVTETITSSTSTTTEATTTTEEATEEVDETETTENDGEETTIVDVNMRTEEVSTVTEETTETELKTISVEIAPPKATVPLTGTTIDSNAINPNYAEYYYHYDNNTGIEDDAYEDEEDEDYNDENGDR